MFSVHIRQYIHHRYEDRMALVEYAVALPFAPTVGLSIYIAPGLYIELEDINWYEPTREFYVFGYDLIANDLEEEMERFRRGGCAVRFVDDFADVQSLFRKAGVVTPEGAGAAKSS